MFSQLQKKSLLLYQDLPPTLNNIGSHIHYIKHETNWLFSHRSTPSVGRTPKDMISAPPVEGLYDARDTATPATPFRWSHDSRQVCC